MSKITSNTQSFQSIYINPDAKRWQDRIVFHEPLFADEMSGVIALKSYRLEDCSGLVVNAPASRLRYFRDCVKKTDSAEQWGKLELPQIMDNLTQLAQQVGGTIVYVQDRAKAPKTKIDGEPMPKTDKKKKVKRGKSAGGVMPDVEREISGTARSIYSPSMGVYLANISTAGKRLWNRFLSEAAVTEQVSSIEDTRERWNYVTKEYETMCVQLSIYKTEVLSSAIEIRDRMALAIKKGQRELLNVYHNLEVSNLVERKTKLTFNDVKILGDSVFVISSCAFNLKGEREPQEVLASVKNKVVFERSVLKRVDERTSLTFREERPYILTSYLSYSLPMQEATHLFGNDPNKIRLGLIKLATA